MRQIQTLTKQLQRHARHDPRRNSKHSTINPLTRRPIPFTGDFKPQRRYPRADRLREAAEHEACRHGFRARVERQVERESHREAFGDVVDEEGEEDGHAQFWVGVVGRVGDEAFGELVQGDGDGGL